MVLIFTAIAKRFLGMAAQGYDVRRLTLGYPMQPRGGKNSRCIYPNGVLSLSPGLDASSYPWVFLVADRVPISDVPYI